MLSVTIDSSGLNAALAKALEFSKRTPAQMVNTVALQVALGAQQGMPFVTVPTIDTELGVAEERIIGKRGKPLSGKNIRNKILSGGRMGTGDNADVPLAVLIIQARATPGSNYNQLTHNRYAGPSPFKGVSREAGRVAMAAAVHRMIASRHSSIKFLFAGWNPAISKLIPHSVNKWVFGGKVARISRQGSAGLGDATPAMEGSINAVCVIENDIGYEGVNRASFNEALLKYGTEPLQRAIDNEGMASMKYYWEHAAKELEREFNKAAS